MKKIKISRRFVFNIALLLSVPAFTIHLQAQHGWSVNPADFENSMQVTAEVSFDGALVTSGTLGAFVNDECRGFVDALEFGPGVYLFDFLVYSNQSSGEILTIRYYNPDDGLIYDVNETIGFGADTREGDAINPLALSVTTNGAPMVASPIGDLSLDEYFGSTSIDLDTVFSDPENDPLTYSAGSDNTAVVNVSIGGSILTITEAGPGSSTVTVTADDGAATTDDVFTVTVNDINRAPVVERAVDDLVLDEYFGTTTVDLTNVFSDPDGDELVLSAVSGNTGVVTVTVTGTTLTIAETGIGSSVITVTASDGFLSVEDQFSITVIDINAAPELMEPIPDQNIVENIGSAELGLDAYFSDRNGDALVYSVAMGDAGIVSYVLDQSLLLLTPVDTGSTMVTITATDPEGLMAEDSFMVYVEKEQLFIVQYGSRRLQNWDTIILCNDAGQIPVKVFTKATWDFTNDHLWMALEIKQDSTLSVAFSANLTGEDRIGDVTVFSAQSHVLKFFVKQTENCLTNVFPDDRLFDLKMYPNPVEGQLFIDTGERLRRGLKVEVIDQQGKLLFVEEVEEDAPDVPLEIDMRGYTAGPYFIRISDDRGSFTEKIVKQ